MMDYRGVVGCLLPGLDINEIHYDGVKSQAAIL